MRRRKKNHFGRHTILRYGSFIPTWRRRIWDCHIPLFFPKKKAPSTVAIAYYSYAFVSRKKGLSGGEGKRKRRKKKRGEKTAMDSDVKKVSSAHFFISSFFSPCPSSFIRSTFKVIRVQRERERAFLLFSQKSLKMGKNIYFANFWESNRL